MAEQLPFALDDGSGDEPAGVDPSSPEPVGFDPGILSQLAAEALAADRGPLDLAWSRRDGSADHNGTSAEPDHRTAGAPTDGVPAARADRRDPTLQLFDPRTEHQSPAAATPPAAATRAAHGEPPTSSRRRPEPEPRSGREDLEPLFEPRLEPEPLERPDLIEPLDLDWGLANVRPT